MSIVERYRKVRVPALSGLEQARARLEAAERRRVARTAQQVAAGQLLLHDPEVRLAMGPEQEAEAYERLNDLEASIGLPPTPYVDVPKQEFAKQIHAGQVTVAERALPAGERETLLDNLADATIARFGTARVARYLVDLRNQQTLARAAMRQGQGEPEAEVTEPPMGARQWVRSLIEPHAPPAVEAAAPEQAQQPEGPARSVAPYQQPEPMTVTSPEAPATAPTVSGPAISTPGPVGGLAAGVRTGAAAGKQAGRRPAAPAARPAGRPEPLPIPSLRDYGEAWKFSPERQQWATDEVDRDPSLIMDFLRFRERYRKKYGDNALGDTPEENLRDLWRYASDTTRAWLQRVRNGPRLKDPNKRYQVQQLRRDHADWTRKQRKAEAEHRGWSPEAFDAAWFGYGAKTGPTAGEEVPNLRPIKGDVGVLATLREVPNVELAPPPPEASGRPVTTGVRARAFVEGVGRGIEALFPTLAGSALALESYPVSVVSPGTAQTMREAAGLGFDWAESIMRGGQAAADVRAEPTKPGKTHYIPSWIPLIGGQDIQVPSLQGATAIVTDIAPDVAREAAAFLLGAKAAEATESVVSADDIAQFIARRTATWSPEARLAAGRAILNAGPKNLAFTLGSGGVTGDPKQDAKNLALGAVLFGLMGGAGEYARFIKWEAKQQAAVEAARGDSGAREATHFEARSEAARRAGGAGPELTAPDLEGRKALKSGPIEVVLQQANELQPRLDTFGNALAAQVPGARWFGSAKSRTSIESKVGRKQADGKTEYTPADLNDHIRGTVLVQDWADAPAVIRKLRASGFAPDGSVFTPMNDFGFMGAKGERLVGPLGAEVQVWTPEGWKLKEWSDGIYAKWRDLGPNPDLRALPEEVQRAYLADMDRSRSMWAEYWDKVDLKVRRAIEDALTEGAQ